MIMDRIAEELKKLKQNNQLRTIPKIDSKSDGKIVVDGVEYVNFASNELRDEFLKKSDFLLSSASARLLTGSSPEYRELEKIVADIFNKESALIFNTGYQANLGVVSALIGKVMSYSQTNLIMQV